MIHRKLKANFTEYFLKDASRDTEKKEILSYRKNISWNQLFSNFIIKNGTFTKFLLNQCDSKFPQFPHCAI